MRIEDVTKIKLSKACDKELLILKLRFTQLWDKNFKSNADAIVGSLDRNSFLKNYKLLLDEMNSRRIEKSTSDIDKAIFKKAMTANKFGIDVSDFEDIVVVPDFIFANAANVSSEKLMSTIDIAKLNLIGDIEKNDDPEYAYIPLYDLVLKAKQETVIVEISKPYPNEHSARLQDPDKFDPKAFRRTKGGTLYGSKKVPSTVSIIWGKLKGKAKPSDPPIAQALRFPTKNWTVTKAKKWLADNEIKFTGFEPATKTSKKMWNKKYIDELPDSAFLYIKRSKNDKDAIKKAHSETNLEDFEYLLHHIVVGDDGNEEIHHCLLYDHVANMFEQGHLVIKDNQVTLDGKKIKAGSFHILKGLESSQEVVWSDEEANENKIAAKKMTAGMTLKEKSKVW